MAQDLLKEIRKDCQSLIKYIDNLEAGDAEGAIIDIRDILLSIVTKTKK